MRFFGVVFFVLAVIFVVNLGDALVQQAMRSPVYACSEVTKHDPKDVQDICNRVRRK